LHGLKENSGTGLKEQFCPLWTGDGIGQPGETAAALAEFDTLLANDPGLYCGATSWPRKTLATAGRTQDAIARLKAGISCATRSGNRHAVSEMQCDGHARRVGQIAFRPEQGVTVFHLCTECAILK